MQFSAMTMNMFIPDNDDPADDHRIIEMTAAQTVWLAELGYHPWFTDHHFRGPWHSNPMQFAAYIAPQIPKDRFMGFGVLSIPLYHPVRLVESMNLLDHLTKGRVLFGVGSGWQGTEPNGLGVDKEHHASGRAAEETLDVMERLWSFKYGDPHYRFQVGANSGVIERRVMPAPYSTPHPTIIRTASREAGMIRAAEKGWPTFLGVFGADLGAQARLYRQKLDAAGHPKQVREHCLRWSTHDWIAVTVAETDEKAMELSRVAKAETMAIRQRYVGRHGQIGGAVQRPTPGQSTAEGHSRGDDLRIGTIAGSPDTVAAEVQRVADLGVNHLLLRFMGEWDGETRHICQTSAELFAREVMPRFASERAGVLAV